MPDELNNKLERLPASPGVYLFKDKEGKIIYIGKAKVLRNRVKSYFTGGSDGRAHYDSLVRSIADLEFIVTESEIEALILEANLIKRYHPRFNIYFRDDKFFPYLKVTREKFPRAFLIRQQIDDGSEYYGPFTEVKKVKRLIKTFKEAFQIRNCKHHITPEGIAKGKYELCLDYHIGQCAGVCRGLQSAEAYCENLKKFIRLTRGQVSGVIADLKREMHLAADELRFEEAARLRDRLKVVEDFAARQTIISDDRIDRDVFGFASEDDEGCIVVMRVREGKVLGREQFFLKGASKNRPEEIIGAFIKQFYLSSDFVPRQLFLPFESEDSETLEGWLRHKREGAVDIIIPHRGFKAKLLKLAAINAELLLGERRRAREAKDKIAHSVKALKEGLNLPTLPITIEAFDISNISGTLPTASMVVFKNGNSFKSGYRKYNIKTVEGIDDFAMMAEAVRRRYSRLLAEKGEMPDLILVDGGKGQLSSAQAVLKEFKKESQPIIGLAKRLDEVFLPDSPDPVNLPRNSSALKLLQRIRDEAHRFAITHHRNRRSRVSVKSTLDEISGVGESRKILLLKQLGSIKKIAEAEIDELAGIKGIDRRTAKAIHEYFARKKLQPNEEVNNGNPAASES